VAERRLITGGTVVTAQDVFDADVLVQDGVIAAVGRDLDVGDAELIDATGRYVLPGGVDTHTHMSMPNGDLFTADDFTSGTGAAACGGTTTIVDFAIQAQGAGLHATVDRWHAKLVEAPPLIDVGFHLAVTDFTVCRKQRRSSRRCPTAASRASSCSWPTRAR
jgi:dihydropyrimidinase